MEPKRERGDDRTMWRAINPDGDWAMCETEQDAWDIVGEDYRGVSGYTVERVVVTAEEWNAMPEFEGW